MILFFVEMVIVVSSFRLLNLDIIKEVEIEIDYFKIVKKGGGYKG